jgi:trans-aconitate methyltransferase
MMNRHFGIIDGKIVLQFITLSQKQKLLDKTFLFYDVGCGTGVRTEYLIMLTPDTDIVGIDLSKKSW